MHKILTISELEEGMVLHEPATNKFGQTLYSAGTSLTVKIIENLKKWDIQSVIVQGDEDNEHIEFSEEQKVAAGKYILNRMKWEPENIFEEEIFQMGINQYLNNTQGKQ